MHAPFARTRSPTRATQDRPARGSLIAMSHATPWERAAEQLHTAAADVIDIAARREKATSQNQPTRTASTPKPGHAKGWMSDRQPVDPDSRFDTSVAHPARIYAYWIGGKDHYEADRKAAEEVIRLRPQVVASARANRAFLARVVRYLAGGCGIRQFVDVGTDLPAPDSPHQVAQRVDPSCRIVYVDNDPMVLTHARALLTSTPQGACGYVDADLHEPETIVAQAAQTVDFARPVAILLLAVLHFITDDAGPAEIVARLASALAPGSYLAISHLTGDFAPDQVAAATAAYNTQCAVPVIARTHAQITGLVGGLPLLAPGVVPIGEWRPEVGDPFGQPADLHAGLARIPQRRAHPGGRA